MKSAEIFQPWFSVYRKDRKDGYGGVFLAVKNGLISEEITIVGALYRPPNSDIEYAQDVIAFLERVVNKHPKAVHWLAGDYNLPDINWETQHKRQPKPSGFEPAIS